MGSVNKADRNSNIVIQRIIGDITDLGHKLAVHHPLRKPNGIFRWPITICGNNIWNYFESYVEPYSWYEGYKNSKPISYKMSKFAKFRFESTLLR